MRREDQDKINRFSTLHQRVKLLDSELQSKQVGIVSASQTWLKHFHLMIYCALQQKDKEDLEEVSGELELADEDEKVS